MRQFVRITLSELFRMFARKRTYIGFGALIAVDLLIIFLLHITGAQEKFVARLDSLGVLANSYFGGLTVGFMFVMATAVILCTLYLALVSGDVIAKESEDGNLRMILSRPVSRLRLLLSKFVAIQIYTVGFFLFLGLISYVLGSILYGWTDGFVVIGERGEFSIFPFGEGLLRYFGATLTLGLGMSVISSIGFVLSCQPMKPAAATILAISIVFIDRIARLFPFLSDYEAYFLTSKMEAFVLTLRDPLPWPVVIHNLAFLFGISATCFIIGWLTFERRDLKA